MLCHSWANIKMFVETTEPIKPLRLGRTRRVRLEHSSFNTTSNSSTSVIGGKSYSSSSNSSGSYRLPSLAHLTSPQQPPPTAPLSLAFVTPSTRIPSSTISQNFDPQPTTSSPLAAPTPPTLPSDARSIARTWRREGKLQSFRRN